MRGHGVDIHATSNQPARLASNSFLPTKYLASLDEVAGTDSVVDPTSYPLSRDLVDSFSGYSSLLSWNHEDVSSYCDRSLIHHNMHNVRSLSWKHQVECVQCSMTLIVHCLIVQRLVVKYWIMNVTNGVTNIPT